MSTIIKVTSPIHTLDWYRQNVLKKFNDKGSRIMQFLLDINIVYPGIIDGEIKEGLTLKEIDSPTSSPEVELLTPPAKGPRLDDDDIERAIVEDSSDSNQLPKDFF